MAAFEWQVAVKGYEWKRRVEKVQFHGVDMRPLRDELLLEPLGRRFRTYAPMEGHGGLFRTFGSTPITQAGILAFANKYGSLGATATHQFPSRKGDPSARHEDLEWSVSRVSSPLTFQEWESAILEMRNALDLWDRIQRNEGTPTDSQELQELVDRQLSSLRVVVRFNLGAVDAHNALHPAMPVIPLTLIGAMWIQLAQSIVAGKAFRSCPSCKRWFELVPELNRTSRHYCSEACRSRAYRSRKEQARELHRGGMSVRQIAEQLDSAEDTIRGWLRGGQQ